MSESAQAPLLPAATLSITKARSKVRKMRIRDIGTGLRAREEEGGNYRVD